MSKQDNIYHISGDSYEGKYLEECAEKFMEWAKKYNKDDYMVYRDNNAIKKLYFKCCVWDYKYNPKKNKKKKILKIFDTLKEAEEFLKIYQMHNTERYVEIRAEGYSGSIDEERQLRMYHVSRHPVEDKDFNIVRETKININEFVISL
jgi:hypothetical protein